MTEETTRDALIDISEDLRAIGYLITEHLLFEQNGGALNEDDETSVCRHFQRALEAHAAELEKISENME